MTATQSANLQHHNEDPLAVDTPAPFMDDFHWWIRVTPGLVLLALAPALRYRGVLASLVGGAAAVVVVSLLRSRWLRLRGSARSPTRAASQDAWA